MKRKTITAFINGSLYIDPIDSERVNIEEIKKKVKSIYKKDVPIIVAPIKTWMPKSGIAAIEKEVMKDLGIPSNAKGLYGAKKHKI
jgi:hypothetical protein